jgi:VIT1/CCC1 family predicted Fe2+/Mn2+ transporter
MNLSPSPRHFSYGGSAAIVTNMSLIIGFEGVDASKVTVLTSLLIVAIADNLTDSLSIHMYQESEQMESRIAFLATLSNFAIRFGLSLSFIFLVFFLPLPDAAIAAIIWGLVLLGILTYTIARSSQRAPAPEIIKHLAIAIAIMLASKALGYMIARLV